MLGYLSQILFTALAGVLFWIASIVIFRLTFHPLAKYPGPIFGRITDWYSVCHAWAGDRHLDFYRLHEVYGPVVRLGPNRISLNTNTALKDIYHVHANVQKSQIYSTYKYFFDVPMSMTTIDKKKHAFKRRINVKALAAHSTKGNIDESMLKYIRLLCQGLIDRETVNGKWSSARNMTKLLSYVTSDIMGETVFSRNWNVLQSDEHRDILEFLPEGVAGVNLTGYMPAILKFKLDKIFFRKLTRDTFRFKALTEAQSTWRVQQNEKMEGKDIFATLMEAKDPETGLGLTQSELISEAGLLIIAGSDTMASTVTSTFFYLLQNPRTMVRLQKGIRRHFDDVEEIRSGPKLQSCRYLFACLDESMRFTPPVGAALPRETLAGGITVDGIWFPERVDLAVPIYSLHHNEAYFPDSFTYKPERWLVGEGDSTAASVALAQSAFHPFGTGRTSCVGQNFAYQEMSIILARVIWLYDMRLEPGSIAGEGHPGLGRFRERRDQFQTWDKFLSAHEGPMVEFKVRTV